MTKENSEPTLKIGDPAPPLEVARWLKGEPVSRLEKGTLYVVEFWATWCGPCVREIPEMSKLQQQHPDVVFIGMNCLEDDETTVVKFVSRMGEKMAFRVARDDGKNGVMKRTWLDATKEYAIPRAFIVDKEGRIAWMGHPAAMKPELEAIKAGTYDMALRALFHDLNRRLREAILEHKYDRALTICDEFIDASPEMAIRSFFAVKFDMAMRLKDRALVERFAAVMLDLHKNKGVSEVDLAGAGPSRGMHWAVKSVLAGTFDFERETRSIEFHEKVDAAQQTGDSDSLMALCDEFERAFPERTGSFGYQLFQACKVKKNAAVMNRAAAGMAEHNQNNAPFLNFLAWSMVDPEAQLEGVDLDLALKMALRAVEVTAGENAGMLDTAARVYFCKGELGKAVELQSAAVAKAEAELKDQLKLTHDKYAAENPPK